MANDHSILSTCKSKPYYPHANLYPIIPMQIYTLLSPCKSIPYYPHGMITPPFPVLPIFTTNACLKIRPARILMGASAGRVMGVTGASVSLGDGCFKTRNL